ncbi:CSRN2 protein, partial [Cercotrichas coryphoeus]|nr:CSRN2 protein [Cercotrichas coryphoeus]
MKLELESRRQEQQEEEEGAPAPPAPPTPSWPPPPPPETQDFQEYLAENERAVLHLQTAEELERLKAEEDSGSGSGGEGGGLCVLGEQLGDTWQVKAAPCPGLGSTLLIPAQFPLEPPVLCSQPYLAQAPEAGPAARAASAHLQHPAAASSPPGKELGVPPGPAAGSKGGAPGDLPEHLEHPHLPI